ncbi:MAG: tRNA (N6-threonylcarbamoyladenosine(37)-N6)-methyltransferase TrmO [Alphaproteobacteria bacterium]
MHDEKRTGEVALPFDPADTAADGAIIFIGKIRSPWRSRAECPRNIAQARERGQTAVIDIDPAWRAGLTGLEAHGYGIVLYWMNQARRDLILQKPRHKTELTGVFALRSPVRPNPIALAVVKLLNVDHSTGRITIDAIDCLDGTPVVDVKPWYASIDAPTAGEEASPRG